MVKLERWDPEDSVFWESAGTPQYALYGFAAYYVTCLVLNWWYYARKNAEVAC